MTSGGVQFYSGYALLLTLTFWDRDTWKYVTKYHVKLPQEFVDYVMSGAGDEFAREHIPWARSWFQHIVSVKTTAS